MDEKGYSFHITFQRAFFSGKEKGIFKEIMIYSIVVLRYKRDLVKQVEMEKHKTNGGGVVKKGEKMSKTSQVKNIKKMVSQALCKSLQV